MWNILDIQSMVKIHILQVINWTSNGYHIILH